MTPGRNGFLWKDRVALTVSGVRTDNPHLATETDSCLLPMRGVCWRPSPRFPILADEGDGAIHCPPCWRDWFVLFCAEPAASGRSPSGCGCRLPKRGTGSAPQAMAALRNLVINWLRIRKGGNIAHRPRRRSSLDVSTPGIADAFSTLGKPDN